MTHHPDLTNAAFGLKRITGAATIIVLATCRRDDGSNGYGFACTGNHIQTDAALPAMLRNLANAIELRRNNQAAAASVENVTTLSVGNPPTLNS